MTSELGLKVLLSFIVGAACVSAFSVTADRFGSKVSGVLASFPATLAASLFLLALSATPETAAAEASAIPALMGFFGVFLSAYCMLARRGFGIALTVSLALWLVLSCIILFKELSVYLSLSVFAIGLVFCSYFLEKVLHLPARPGGRVDLTLSQVGSRMLAGGTIVAGSVYLGAMSGPELGAIFAAFPAVTIATLFVTYRSGGAALSTAFAKSLMIGSMVNSTVLSMALYLLFPRIDPYLSLALALAAVCASSLLTWKVVERMA